MESLEQQDMEYLLKLNEYIDVMDYLEETHYKDINTQTKAPPLKQMR